MSQTGDELRLINLDRRLERARGNYDALQRETDDARVSWQNLNAQCDNARNEMVDLEREVEQLHELLTLRARVAELEKRTET